MYQQKERPHSNGWKPFQKSININSKEEPADEVERHSDKILARKIYLRYNDFSNTSIRQNPTIRKSRNSDALFSGLLFDESFFTEVSDNWKLDGQHWKITIPVELTEYSKQIIQDYICYFSQCTYQDYRSAVRRIDLNLLNLPLC